MGNYNKDAAALPLPPIPKAEPIKELIQDRIQGVDVSHWESRLNWSLTKASGVHWMFAKATEAIGFKDKYFKFHIEDAKKAQVKVGAYHFFEAKFSGIDQADHFLKYIAECKVTLDLPLCLDWEVGSDGGLPVATQKTRALEFLQRLESKTSRVPIIYGGYAFLRDLNLSDAFKRYPLWLAHYGIQENKLKVPKPWSDWTMWQYTDAGHVPGLPQKEEIDLNYFKGSLEDLEKLCKT
jgi:lysozyme